MSDSVLHHGGEQNSLLRCTAVNIASFTVHGYTHNNRSWISERLYANHILALPK